MRIEQLEFWDTNTGWHLTPTKFFPDLTLLVGVSGVGKTRILKSIERLSDISRGKSEESWGIQWNVQCEADAQYRWEGELESKPGTTPRSGNGQHYDSENPEFLQEKLTCDGTEIVRREREQFWFNEATMPKLSPHDSILNVLKREDDIEPVSEGFRYVGSHKEIEVIRFSPSLEVMRRQFPTVERVQESTLPPLTKLALVQETAPETFHEVVRQFTEVFPQVDSIRFLQRPILSSLDAAEIQIREKGIGQWVPQREVASGMFRTLFHLSNWQLAPDGAVILIDEFENSLGTNCLSAVTDAMMDARRRLQFIITSHHPYIINQVPSKHWKIVTRKGSEVSTHNADELGIGRSHHQAFLQLMNHDLYVEGITEG